MTGQEAFLAGHCPVTGRYFEPCRLTISEDTGFSSTEELGNKLTNIVESSQKCFGVLIVPPDKFMLLCFKENAICLFESHSHGQHGGLIATSTTCNIHNCAMY